MFLSACSPRSSEERASRPRQRQGWREVARGHSGRPARRRPSAYPHIEPTGTASTAFETVRSGYAARSLEAAHLASSKRPALAYAVARSRYAHTALGFSERALSMHLTASL